MKRIAALLLLAAGCSSGGQSGKMTEEEFLTAVASTIAFDPALVKVGEHVAYFVKRLGELETQKYSWAVVGEQEGTVWIENKVPFGELPMIVKTRIERGGKIVEQWVGEPGGEPGRTFPHPGKADAEAKPVRDPSTAQADSKEEPDRIIVVGKPYDCIRLTTVLKYPDGRKSTMINWFSREVPFAATAKLGGLVKRQFGRLTMEYAGGDFKGARSELMIPPPSK